MLGFFLDPWDWEKIVTDVNQDETTSDISLLSSMNNKQETFIRYIKVSRSSQNTFEKVDGQM